MRRKRCREKAGCSPYEFESAPPITKHSAETVHSRQEKLRIVLRALNEGDYRKGEVMLAAIVASQVMGSEK